MSTADRPVRLLGATLHDGHDNALLIRVSPVCSPPRVLMTMVTIRSGVALTLRLPRAEARRWTDELDRWARLAQDAVGSVNWPQFLPGMSPLCADDGAALTAVTTTGASPRLWIAGSHPVPPPDGEEGASTGCLIATLSQVRRVRDGLADCCEWIEFLVGTGLVAGEDQDATATAGGDVR